MRDMLEDKFMRWMFGIVALMFAALGFAACTGRLDGGSLCGEGERYDMGPPMFQTFMAGKVPVQQVHHPFAKCVKVEP